MATRIYLPVFLLVFLCSASLPQTSQYEFNLDTTRDHLSALSQTIGVRVAGTSGEQQAAEYIASKFTEYGLEAEIQPFSARAVFVGDITSANVIGTNPGIDPGYGTIYVGAHYDSVKGSPGANDNASGTAVVLEVARIFATHEISPTIKFIAFGAEEYGLLGSKYFTEQLDFFDIHFSPGMINLDCVGYGTGQVASTITGTDFSLVIK